MRTPAALLPVVLLTPLLAAGCSGHGNPVAPSQTAAISATAATTALNTSAPDLARCLQDSGDPDCFSPRTAAVVSPPPGAPSSFGCSVNGGLVVFSWLAPTTGDPVATYRMQAGSSSGGTQYADFNTNSTTPSYTAFAVATGSYYVRVLAVNSSSQIGSPSNEMLLTVGTNGGCFTPGQTTGGVPGPPRSLVNASQSAGTISLTWQAPSSGGTPTSYVLVAGSAPGRSDLANADLGNTNLSYLATSVPAGTYYVRVYAKNSAGLSTASNEVLVYVIAFDSETQVSVSWDAAADVDLHVVEPSGNEIYYSNKTSSTGGQLDVDSNAGCSIDGRQIENIRWSRAPAGTYTVRVDYWSACSVTQTNYTVTVKNGGSTQTFTGNFTGSGDRGGSGSGRLITTFIKAASSISPTFRDALDGLIAPAPMPLSPAAAEKIRLMRGR